MVLHIIHMRSVCAVQPLLTNESTHLPEEWCQRPVASLLQVAIPPNHCVGKRAKAESREQSAQLQSEHALFKARNQARQGVWSHIFEQKIGLKRAFVMQDHAFSLPRVQICQFGAAFAIMCVHFVCWASNSHFGCAFQLCALSAQRRSFAPHRVGCRG